MSGRAECIYQYWTQYIGECIVSIMKIDKVSKNLCVGYQDCKTSQILIFGEYVKMRESFVYLSYYLGPYHSKSYRYLGGFT